jgi:hypothetical protein
MSFLNRKVLEGGGSGMRVQLFLVLICASCETFPRTLHVALSSLGDTFLVQLIFAFISAIVGAVKSAVYSFFVISHVTRLPLPTGEALADAINTHTIL